MKHPEIDKSQIALRFAQAGQSYTEHAVVQKNIAQQLFNLISEYCPAHYENVFEIGCGSGNLTELLLQNLQIKHLILNDLYPEVQQHFPLDKPIEYRIGDIEQLEFPKHLDLISSSSVLQWMSDLNGIFQQAFHHLNPKAYFCFSTFGQHNLQEIKSLTGQGLNYLSLDDLQQQLKRNGFEILHISEQIEHLNFPHPKYILQHLKATGVTATASGFRWTKQSLADFYHHYQQFSQADQSGNIRYSLTYHPIYCILRRMS